MKMNKVKILGVELEAPLLNPELAQRFEEGFQRAVKRINDASKNENGSADLKEQCSAVIDYIDDIFGNGSARRVFGEETDMITCIDALEEMSFLYERQIVLEIQERMDRFSHALEAKAGDNADA